MEFTIHKLDREWAGQQVKALGGALETPTVYVTDGVAIGGIAWLPAQKQFVTGSEEVTLAEILKTHGVNVWDAAKDFAGWLGDYAQLAQELQG